MRAEQRRAALNAVGTSLIHGLAGGNVGADLFFGQVPEMNIRHFRESLYGFSAGHRHAGHHLMIPARKQLQHGHRLFLRVGFSQHTAFADHDGISSHYHIFPFAGDGHGF